eukprot:GEMP01040581.1.p1 GENE.GEMP01040581.1~~GEMP01040581.1.p1  ORF type:complete len:137 (+),score=1.65 GEMP01040581.1:298-708(+)
MLVSVNILFRGTSLAAYRPTRGGGGTKKIYTRGGCYFLRTQRQGHQQKNLWSEETGRNGAFSRVVRRLYRGGKKVCRVCVCVCVKSRECGLKEERKKTGLGSPHTDNWLFILFLVEDFIFGKFIFFVAFVIFNVFL